MSRTSSAVLKSNRTVMMLGALLAATMLTMPGLNLHGMKNDDRRKPVLVQIIDAAGNSPSGPSAYDLEAGMSGRQLLDRWDTAMSEASQRFHIPKAWIRAVMQRESGGRTMLGDEKPMVSRAGALGLMQVEPDTYAEMRRAYKLGDDPFDAHDNIMAGAAYLRWLHKRYGFPAMFAAYNAGPGRLEDHLYHGEKLPAETRAYVGGITRVLGPHMARDGAMMVKFTRPDGTAIRVAVDRVTAIRAAAAGEYAPGVKTVLSMGHHHQGIRENIAAAKSALQAVGGLI